MRLGTFALVMLFASLAMGAQAPQQLGEPMKGPPVPPAEPAPKPPPATAATQPAAASQAIAKDALVQLYRVELGDKFNPALADKLYDAHGLLEKYFAATTNAQRTPLAKQLATAGLDANLVGRIARIRMYWPQLQEGTYYVNERVGQYNVIYFLGIPKGYDRMRSWPLVIKLADSKPFDTDPLPTAQQVVRLYDGWIKSELRQHPDAVVLMPLMNLEELWGPSTAGMNNVIQPMLHASGRVNVDPKRVYLMGNGLPVWNLAIHYPTYFAAIAAQSGGAGAAYQTPRLRNLRDILSVVWHDTTDKDVPVKESQDVVKAIRALKYDIDYEETKGIGSTPTEQIIARMYAKIRARTRELYPKEVVLGSNRPESTFNRNDWIQVYQQAATGNELKYRWLIGSGSVTLYASSYDVTARLAATNSIEIQSRNLDVMRVYFNDQMVDFSKPISIKANGRVRFQETLKPSMDEMLMEQIALGRGWRYFTAHADIDYGVNAEPPAPPRRGGGGGGGEE